MCTKSNKQSFVELDEISHVQSNFKLWTPRAKPTRNKDQATMSIDYTTCFPQDILLSTSFSKVECLILVIKLIAQRTEVPELALADGICLLALELPRAMLLSWHAQ